MIKSISSKNNKVELGELQDSSLNSLLLSKYKNSQKIIILDENTQENCWPILMSSFDELSNAELIVLPAGEENKSLEVCYQVWEAFSSYQIQRSDLIINLGGGVVTDIGGFIASVYKRGLDFINIPTTLLAMVDASVGGKTGVNLSTFKNQLGVFAMPELTVCDPVFLYTLHEKELIAGKAEMLKHGLIAAKELFSNLLDEQNLIPTAQLIADAIQVKADIVDRDFKEQGERKKLNFGHTIGHSIESLLLEREVEVTHGECVAWGMLVETYLSAEKAGLSSGAVVIIENTMRQHYRELPISKDDFADLLVLMQHDKKNKGTKINFTLLKEIGVAEIDFNLEAEEILPALSKVFTK